MTDEDEVAWTHPDAPREVLTDLVESMLEESLTQLAAATISLHLYQAGIPITDEGHPITEAQMAAAIAYHLSVYEALLELHGRSPLPEPIAPDTLPDQQSSGTTDP